MAKRLQPVKNLLKLLDTCAACCLAFRTASENDAEHVFYNDAEHLQLTLQRFIHELQSEARRMGDVEFLTLQPNPINAVTLDNVVKAYKEVLGEWMPPHARAMIQRQCGTLCEFQESFRVQQRRMSA